MMTFNVIFYIISNVTNFRILKYKSISNNIIHLITYVFIEKNFYLNKFFYNKWTE